MDDWANYMCFCRNEFAAFELPCAFVLVSFVLSHKLIAVQDVERSLSLRWCVPIIAMEKTRISFGLSSVFVGWSRDCEELAWVVSGVGWSPPFAELLPGFTS